MAKKLQDATKLSNADLEAQAYDFEEVQSAVGFGSVRKGIDYSSAMTPVDVASKLESSKSGDSRAFCYAVTDLLQKDLNHVAARENVISTAAEAFVSFESGDTSAKSTEVADYVATVFKSDEVQAIIPHLMQYKDFGYSAYENIWDLSNPSEWKITRLVPIAHKDIQFDKTTGRVPSLIPAKQGDLPTPLIYKKFGYIDIPGAGLPFLSSEGLLSAKCSILKSITTKNWAILVETSHKRLRTATLNKSAIGDKEFKKVLAETKRMLAGMDNDSYGVITDGIELEFHDAVQASSASVYQDFIRYLDEKQTILITGSQLATGTGNTGSGGSNALGQVHSKTMYRKAKLQLEAVLKALMEYTIIPLVHANFGPDAVLPIVNVSFETTMATTDRITAMTKLADYGVSFSADEARALLQMRAPVEGEAVLVAPAKVASPAPAPAFSKFATETANPAPDAIDELIAEFSATGNVEDNEILTAISSATTFEELKASLIKFIESADVSAKTEGVASIITASEAAGEFGADIGTK
jgi:phage gp29-like protein